MITSLGSVYRPVSTQFNLFKLILSLCCKVLLLFTKRMSSKYAIVIDAGSSGSRALVYQFSSDKQLNPNGLPTITQIGYKKIKPGLSTFNKQGKMYGKDIWDDYFEDIYDEIKKIIPKSNRKETPVFIQATAGMRLLPTIERDRILKETCNVFHKETDFQIYPCDEHVEVIDGDIEGLYGWLALNYLTNRLTINNGNDDENNKSYIHPYGFMDMGGASTQLAFVPSSNDQLTKHLDDLYTVKLRKNNGELFDWSVFVSSWLGFGANEARVRQLESLVNALPKNVNYDKDGDGKADLMDPCSPVGMKTDVEYNNGESVFTITGSGNYENCLKTIYPLLLKNLPCSDEPCLFNGVHAPSMNFALEKFVGVSEYWYTANDVFKLTGDYNYNDFEKATKEFCNTDWDIIMNRFNNKEYGENLTLELLRTSCFKASWIVNILHEGFDIPRLGIDDDSELKESDEPVFRSVNNINGNELSWTLGKMVLYASSQINDDGSVGIYPGSAIDNSKSSNNQIISDPSSINNSNSVSSSFLSFIIFLLLCGGIYYIILKKFGGLKKMLRKIQNNKTESVEDMYGLEEGRSLSHQKSIDNFNIDGLRTRSTMNLHELQNLSPVIPPPMDKQSEVSSSPNSPFDLQFEGLKHSFTFSSFRDPTLYHHNNNHNHNSKSKFNPIFKLGNGSSQSLKSTNQL